MGRVAVKAVTLRFFADRVGVAAGVVRKAVRTGRLDKSVAKVDGRPMITDVVLAEREWRENKDHSKDRSDNQPVALTEAKRRYAIAQARKVEIQNAQRMRELISVAEWEPYGRPK